jgi:hypothetical protein
MKKLVALEKVFGLFSKITYAERHDQIEYIKDHDNEIGFYRNLRTGEPFHCRKEKIGYIEQSDIMLLIEKDTTKKKNSYTKARVEDASQTKLF